MIKIDFEMTDGTYTYRDALHLEDDHTLSEVEIEAIKQARFDRWLAVVTAPPVIYEEPTVPVVDTVINQE